MFWANANLGASEGQLFPASLKKFLQYRAICCFWVSILPVVQSEEAVRSLRVIPSSLVQLMNSVLIKAVPRPLMIDCGIPKEGIHYSTAVLVAKVVVLRTG